MDLRLQSPRRMMMHLNGRGRAKSVRVRFNAIAYRPEDGFKLGYCLVNSDHT
jgi:hypothetical protein